MAQGSGLEGLEVTAPLRYDVAAEYWHERRVLVTGHTGFKGGWLVLWLASLGARVAGLGLAPEGPSSFFEAVGLAGDCSSHIGDIRSLADVQEVIADEQPEIVFHLAAQALVRRSYGDPVGTVAANVLGTAHVLEACRIASHVRALLVVTSDKVYENRDRREAYGEDEPLGGHDLYSVSKACAELLTTGYRRSFSAARRRFGLATARAGNVIGGGDWGEDRIVPDLARAFASGKVATVRAPDAQRPWQHVIDVVRGYLMFGRALLDAPEDCPASLNFGPPGEAASVAALADGFASAWGGGCRWRHEAAPGAPHEARRLAIDATRAGQFLGWRTKIALQQALEMSADWYRLHAERGAAKDLHRLSLRQIADSVQ